MAFDRVANPTNSIERHKSESVVEMDEGFPGTIAEALAIPSRDRNSSSFVFFDWDIASGPFVMPDELSCSDALHGGYRESVLGRSACCEYLAPRNPTPLTAG